MCLTALPPRRAAQEAAQLLTLPQLRKYSIEIFRLISIDNLFVPALVHSSARSKGVTALLKEFTSCDDTEECIRARNHMLAYSRAAEGQVRTASPGKITSSST
jgi:hypothetical protein